MRLIDGDELLLRFIPRGGDNPFTRFVRETVRLRVADLPTIEAEPKRGRWEKKSISIKGIETELCSECKTWSYGRGKAFCPNCGADMRGEKDG